MRGRIVPLVIVCLGVAQASAQSVRLSVEVDPPVVEVGDTATIRVLYEPQFSGGGIAGINVSLKNNGGGSIDRASAGMFPVGVFQTPDLITDNTGGFEQVAAGRFPPAFLQFPLVNPPIVFEYDAVFMQPGIFDFVLADGQLGNASPVSVYTSSSSFGAVPATVEFAPATIEVNSTGGTAYEFTTNPSLFANIGTDGIRTFGFGLSVLDRSATPSLRASVFDPAGNQLASVDLNTPMTFETAHDLRQYLVGVANGPGWRLLIEGEEFDATLSLDTALLNQLDDFIIEHDFVGLRGTGALPSDLIVFWAPSPLPVPPGAGSAIGTGSFGMAGLPAIPFQPDASSGFVVPPSPLAPGRWTIRQNFSYDIGHVLAFTLDSGVSLSGQATAIVTEDLARTNSNASAPFFVIVCNAADIADPLGQLTFADISAFLAAYATQDSSADLAAPFGEFTFADISAFLAAFADGCP